MDRQSIGKRNELVIWSKLLEHGINVYPSLVDDKGIDGIVGYGNKYHEVQIKSGKAWMPRGFPYSICKKYPKRIFIIYNYSIKKIIFLTGKEILEETKWKKYIRYGISQLRWNKEILNKYKSNNFDRLVKYLKSK